MEIKIGHSADTQIKNQNKNLYRVSTRALKNIESLVAELKLEIFIIAGDLFEFDVPNDSERKLVYNHIASLLNIPTLRELVIIPGNHDLIKDKKQTESTLGYNPLNILNDMIHNLDIEKSSKLLYMGQSKTYQSKVSDKIQYLCYSLEDDMKVNFNDAYPNKFNICIFHAMIKEYVELDKIPLRKDILNSLKSIDNFPPNTLITAGDIHKNLRFDGIDGQVFHYPGSPIQHTHSEGSYFILGEKFEHKPAEPKSFKVYTFDDEKFDQTLSKTIDTKDIPLTDFVSYITISLSTNIDFEEIKNQLNRIKFQFGVEQTFIKIKSSNIFVSREIEIRNIIELIAQNNGQKRISIDFDYEKFIQKDNGTNNLIIQEIINKKSLTTNEETNEETEDEDFVLKANNIDDLILSNDDIVKLFNSVLEKQLTKSLKDNEDNLTKKDLLEDIINLFRGQLNNINSGTKRYNIVFNSIETSGFMMLIPNRIELNIPGIVRILGTNGIGKTTLYNMIRWCITGEVFSGMSKSQVAKNNLLIFNKKDINQDSVSVVMNLNINEMNVTATRKVERKWKNNITDEQKAYINWKEHIAKVEREFHLTIVGPDGVEKKYSGDTAENAMLLWFGKTLDSILFLNQARIENLLNNGSSVLNEMILSFIGVDYLKKLEDNLDDIKTELMTVIKPKISKDDILMKITDCKIFEKKFTEELELKNNIKIEELKTRDKINESNIAINEKLVIIGDVPGLIKTKESEINVLENSINTFVPKENKEKIIFNEIQPIIDQVAIDVLLDEIKIHDNAINLGKENLLKEEKNLTNFGIELNSACNEILTSLKIKEEHILEESLRLNEENKNEYGKIITYVQDKIKQLQDKQAEVQTLISELSTKGNTIDKTIADNKKQIESGVCEKCNRAFETDFDSHKEKILAENELLYQSLKETTEELYKKQELLKKVQEYIVNYTTILNFVIKQTQEVFVMQLIQKDCQPFIDVIRKNQILIDDETVKLQNNQKLIISVKILNQNILAEDIDLLELEDNNKKLLLDLLKTYKMIDSTVTLLKESLNTRTDKKVFINEDISQINFDYTNKLRAYQEKLNANIKTNNEIDAHNLIVDDHNKKYTENQLNLEKERLAFTILNTLKLPEYNDAKNLLNSYITSQQESIKRLELLNNELKTIELKQLQNVNEAKTNNQLLDDYMKFQKNNIIWKIYSSLIKDNFKNIVFEYYRTFLNNTLNLLLRDVNFKLFWNSESELYMIDYKNGSCAYAPVQQSSGMETTFLGLALIYTMHLLNVKNSVSHIFIDEISGTLNKGKELSYNADDYQKLLVLILSKFTDKTIFIVDHAIDNLFETATYEVRPEGIGSKFYIL